MDKKQKAGGITGFGLVVAVITYWGMGRTVQDMAVTLLGLPLFVWQWILIYAGAALFSFGAAYLIPELLRWGCDWWNRSPNAKWDVEAGKVLSYIVYQSVAGRGSLHKGDAFFIIEKSFKDKKLRLACFDGSSFRLADPATDKLIKVSDNSGDKSFTIQGSMGVFANSKNVLKAFPIRHGCRGNSNPAYW